MLKSFITDHSIIILADIIKFCIMEETNRTMNDLEYVTAGKKRYAFHSSFAKKDSIISNIEIIVACIIAFISGLGIYGLL